MRHKPQDDELIFGKALKIRAFESHLLSLFAQNKIGGTTHTCLGQEFSGVFVGEALGQNDAVISNHRCHGHYLGLTSDYFGLAQELLGRPAGLNGGVGGSQHLALDKRFYSNGIQGGMVAFSAGLAKSLNKAKNGIVVNFLGDGTFGQGALYEGLNISVIQKAPVLFFIENNGISQSTTTTDVISGDIKSKLEAFGIQTYEHKFDELQELRETIVNAVSDIRENPRPVGLIWHCNRLGPHSKGDDTREQDELANLLEKDPLKLYYSSNGLDYEAALNETKTEVAQYFSDEKEHDADATLKTKEKSEQLITWDSKETKGTVLENLQHSLNGYLEVSNGYIVGEDLVDPYGGAFKVTKGLSTNYPDKVIATSISESAIVGYSIGLSILSDAVILELMFGDFIALSADQIINHASKFAYLHHFNPPAIVIRMPIGGGRGYGATHSQSLEKIVGGIPAVTIQQLSFMHSIDSALQSAVNRKGCTVITEPKLQYSLPFKRLGNFENSLFNLNYLNEKTDEEWVCFSSKFETNLTIICSGLSLPTVLEASKLLFTKHELTVSILSPLQTSPLYIGPEILEKLTKKIIVIDETFRGYGFAETLVSGITEQGAGLFNFKTLLIEDGIYPSSLSLEKEFLISPEKIATEVMNFNEI